jgi:hypothetical protein
MASLTAYVARRYGQAIPGEELIQQALTDLWEYQCGVLEDEYERDDFDTLLARRAMVILKRRIADYFRGPRVPVSAEAVDDEAQPDSAPERLLLARIAEGVERQEKVDCILILSGLQPGATLTSTERTRLGRLRARMREELGIDR